MQRSVLAASVAATKQKMAAAEALLSALAGEEARWTVQSKEFDNTIQRLIGKPSIGTTSWYIYNKTKLSEASPMARKTLLSPAGDCAVVSGFVSYLGPFNKDFRHVIFTRNFITHCLASNIPLTPDLNVTTFLIDEQELADWTAQVDVLGYSRKISRTVYGISYGYCCLLNEQSQFEVCRGYLPMSCPFRTA